MSDSQFKIGTRLGPYEIVGVLGAGGMGEVYRARDTSLQRDVAIKVLPAAVAEDATRLMRFEREARALAALNHPNIATVYAIHDRAIVMELVEGEDLSTRVRRGRVPVADALPIARQVAEALAAAHDAGIVHRDLKPANIKLRDDGTVKVLDFGLAKGGSADAGAGSLAGSSSGSGELPPTVTVNPDLTEEGRVLGTAAYMSPEQAKGRAIDKRSDIWSYGVVVFEMLAGRRPFGGAAALDAADTMARVLATEPDWAALPADTPQSIRRLLVRCLQKERKQRLHDIADARLEIDDALAPSAVGPPRPTRNILGAAALVVAALVIGGWAAIALWPRPAADAPVIHARLAVSPELNSGGMHPTVVLPVGGARKALDWSPDGKTLAFIGQHDGVRQIYVRELTGGAARPVAGTEGARTLAVSPDSRQIAFWVALDLLKVNIAGGPPVKICQASDLNGIHWSDDGIVFTQGGVWWIDGAAAGGEPRPLTTTDQLIRQGSPFLLPGRVAVLYTEFRKQWTSGDERVMVQPLQPGAPPRVLLSQAADARYLPTGHLAFLRQGTLFVVPFSLKTLSIEGQPVAVLENVSQSVVAWDSADLTLGGQYAISPQGQLAYVSSGLPRYPDRELVNVDRAGAVRPLGAPIRGYRNHVELSPDGTRLAVSVQTVDDVQLFSLDLARATLSRIADPVKGELNLAAWSRDDQIAVQFVSDGKAYAAIVTPDVASGATPVAGTVGFWPSSWAPDGTLAGMYGGSVWFFKPKDPTFTPRRFPGTSVEEKQPMFSPDGRWIAYTSSASGHPEVYVRPYPGPGEAAMVSVAGGSAPAWNPNGLELFYIEPGASADRMMAAPMSKGRSGSPVPLFSFGRGGMFLGTSVLTPYAVARDGRSFYAVRQLPRAMPPVTEIDFILNWFQDVAKRTAR